MFKTYLRTKYLRTVICNKLENDIRALENRKIFLVKQVSMKPIERVHRCNLWIYALVSTEKFLARTNF